MSKRGAENNLGYGSQKQRKLLILQRKFHVSYIIMTGYIRRELHEGVQTVLSVAASSASLPRVHRPCGMGSHQHSTYARYVHVSGNARLARPLLVPLRSCHMGTRSSSFQLHVRHRVSSAYPMLTARSRSSGEALCADELRALATYCP